MASSVDFRYDKKYSSVIVSLVSIVIVVGSWLIFSENLANAATTFSVNSTLDTSDASAGDGNCNDGSGNCTLRAAIQESNALAGTDTIEFNIAPFDGSVKTIQPGSPLPSIVGATIVNGYTQDDATENTAISPNPLNAILRIQIDGTNAGSSHGFQLDADDIEIRGIVISNFELDGISVENSNDSIIAGNFIGTDPTGNSAEPNVQRGVAGNGGTGNNVRLGGTLPADRNLISGNGTAAQGSGIGIGLGHDDWVIQGNYIGVGVDGITAIPNAQIGGAGSPSIDNAYGTLIGGTAVGAANVISGNNGHGIAPYDADDLVVQGNFIGTDYTGTVAVPNSGSGITVSLSDNVQIGGSGTGERNIIASNGQSGICLGDETFNVRVQGNYIGTAIDGVSDLGNEGAGIAVTCGGTTDSLIGGVNAGEGNIIAFNDEGISVSSSDDNGVAILGNSVFDNLDLGIDLGNDGRTGNDSNDIDVGANELLNYIEDFQFEEVGADTDLTFTLDAPAGEYRIEFFSNSEIDLSGNSEGETFLDFVNVTSSGSGSQNFSHTIVGQTGLTNISSTTTEIDELATSGFGSTSEFSEVATEVGAPEIIVDTNLTKALLNPESVALDSDIVYRFTFSNDGDEGFDMSNLPGDQPGTNSLVLDILPPELTYISQSSSEVTCVDAAPASVFGPALANHSTHRLINCGYTGGADILAPGDDFTFDLTVHVEPTSDLVFTNFAFSSVANEDPDAVALGSAFASGNDIIDEMGSQIGSVGNVGVSAFPVPISTPNTSVVPAPRAGGNLSNTGSQPGVLLWFSTLFIGSGLLFSRKFRKSGHLLK